MSDFKVGDEVWYSHAPMGNVAIEDELTIQKGIITIISLDKYGSTKYFTGTHIVFEDDDYEMHDGYCFYDSEIYKSKQECIDAFKKRLDEL